MIVHLEINFTDAGSELKIYIIKIKGMVSSTPTHAIEYDGFLTFRTREFTKLDKRQG